MEKALKKILIIQSAWVVKKAANERSASSNEFVSSLSLIFYLRSRSFIDRNEAKNEKSFSRASALNMASTHPRDT